MKSAIYEGTVRHRRRGRRAHAFAYRVAMPYLDLDEVELICARHPLWSVERANAVSFRRGDFLGDPTVPLDTEVRNLVEAATGRRPDGPIRLLTHLRTWGWLFNPITLYFCMDADDRRLAALVLEVTNTPWHERHAYVIPGGSGEHRFGKEMHVSPFLGMDQEYRLRVSEPGERLGVELAALEHGVVVLEASLDLERREPSRATLGRLLWRYPLLTVRVSAGIYHQAVRLWAKGVPVHAHPAGRQPVGAASSRVR